MKLPSYLLCLTFLICMVGCQSNKSTPRSDISDLNLLKGNIVLCSGSTFGKVSFSLNCKNLVRDTFDLAVSLLHSFEYGEAEKAFAKVIDNDPDCPMAYWGLAMSLLKHPKFGPNKEGFEKASKVLKIAQNLSKTTREQMYLSAVSAYFDSDWEQTNHIMRAKKMEIKMEEIYTQYTDDKEAAIFYALSLFATASAKDKNYVKQKKAGHILESIFPDQPDHPGIAHYIIHHYDNPDLANLALSTARRYADIAPASSHAQHMPSHIFTRLGLWDESIQSNVLSASAARCYADETEMDGHWHNEIHAMDYLVYAYLQKGDNVRANEQYQQWLAIEIESPLYASPYNFGAIPLRLALENKQWSKAANLTYHEINHIWDNFPWEKSLLHFARSIGAARSGNIPAAETELVFLQASLQELIKKKDEYKSNQVEIQVKASQAWIDFAKGNHERALAIMQEAAALEVKTGKHPVTPGELVPAPELLGDMLLAMNMPAKALEAYELDLKEHPNRFNGLYGAAVAANKAGKIAKAKSYFENLLSLVELSNSDRPEIKEAKEFLKENNNI